jgi:small subunit ribosomal protein S6
MGTYEIVAVLRSDLDDAAVVAVLDRISQRITEHGGTVKTLERWGKRKLAYPIKKTRDGYYVLFVFELEPPRIGSLRQTLGLHEDLLRFTFSTHRAKPTPAAPPATAAAPTPTAPVPASTAPATPPAAPPAPGPAETRTASPPDAPHV